MLHIINQHDPAKRLLAVHALQWAFRVRTGEADAGVAARDANRVPRSRVAGDAAIRNLRRVLVSRRDDRVTSFRWCDGDYGQVVRRHVIQHEWIVELALDAIGIEVVNAAAKRHEWDAPRSGGRTRNRPLRRRCDVGRP